MLSHQYYRAEELQDNRHLWFCCPTSIFPPRKTVLFYLFRGMESLLYDFLSYGKLVSQRVPSLCYGNSFSDEYMDPIFLSEHIPRFFKKWWKKGYSPAADVANLQRLVSGPSRMSFFSTWRETT